MTVFLLMNYEYSEEMGDVVGIYKTREGAQKELEKELDRKRKFDFDDDEDPEWVEEEIEEYRENYSISEWEVED